MLSSSTAVAWSRVTLLCTVSSRSRLFPLVLVCFLSFSFPLVLAAVWGASYLFIKVAVEEMAPATAMAIRVLLAAIFLGGVLLVKQGWRRARVDGAAAAAMSVVTRA